MHPSALLLTRKQLTFYYKFLNIDDRYSLPEVLSTPDGTRIPTIEVHTVRKFLSILKHISPGPDELPFWILRDYAYQLAKLYIPRDVEFNEGDFGQKPTVTEESKPVGQDECYHR